ncbi:MAG: hypothetical protein LWW85_07470 [Marinilabiliales bacterium]|nr:hypothetical protein [Marinilabiliales bacterium]
MTKEEALRELLTKQKAKTERTLTFGLSGITYDEMQAEETPYLEKLIRKVNRLYRFYGIVSILLVTLLLIAFLLKFFEMIDGVNLNKSGLTIFFAFLFLLHTFKSYRYKIHLENKLFLLQMEKILE